MESGLVQGSVVNGYRIDGHLAQGGMGVVYRARHIALDLPVALKLIRPDRAQDPSYRERFKREARMAASLHHPNVVSAQDFGEYQDQLYVVMPLIDATDLATVITDTGPLATDRTAEIVEEIASALGAAHAAGLIHRDVKPANILLATQRDGGERALLTDFGVARAVMSETRLTQVDQLPGTPGYVSPEQIQGGEVDQRSDIYSLGCVLCEALTGTVPYPRHTPALMLMAHISEDPPRVSERMAGVPEAFDAVVRQALAKDPDDRFATAADLAGAVREAAVRDQAAPAEPEPGPDPQPEAVAAPEPVLDPSTAPAAVVPVPVALPVAAASELSPPATGGAAAPPAWAELSTYESSGPVARILVTVGIAAVLGAVAALLAGLVQQAILRSSSLQTQSDVLNGKRPADVVSLAVMTVLWGGALALVAHLARRPAGTASGLVGAVLILAVLGLTAGFVVTQFEHHTRLMFFYAIVGIATGAACGRATRSGQMGALGVMLGGAMGVVAGAVRVDAASPNFVGKNAVALTIVALGLGLAYALAFRPEPPEDARSPTGL